MKTLFYFSADWCQPCQSLKPIMDMVAQKGIPVERINIDYETDRTKAANVTSVPTVVLAENGQEIKRFTGAKSLEFIINFYNS